MKRRGTKRAGNIFLFYPEGDHGSEELTVNGCGGCIGDTEQGKGVFEQNVDPFETGSQEGWATLAPKVRRRGKVTTHPVEDGVPAVARLWMALQMMCKVGSERKSSAGKPRRMWTNLMCRPGGEGLQIVGSRALDCEGANGLTRKGQGKDKQL